MHAVIDMRIRQWAHAIGHRIRLGAVAGAAMLIAAVFATLVGAAPAQADPLPNISEPEPPINDPQSDADLFRPMPIITPTPSNWQPRYPFPWNETKSQVTEADITAEREMCQWFTAQYEMLNRQIDRLQFNRIAPNGTDWDYGANGVQQEADIVTANIRQALDFLAPRAQALTQQQDFAGDWYFPIYKGDAFYRLWQQLSNVYDGIEAHQADWFTGPSYQHARHWGSEIEHSDVCQ
jgi:hypothetical protein